jgi:hypothetical protein
LGCSLLVPGRAGAVGRGTSSKKAIRTWLTNSAHDELVSQYLIAAPKNTARKRYVLPKYSVNVLRIKWHYAVMKKKSSAPAQKTTKSAPTHKLGANRRELATRQRKLDKNFKQSKDVREDRGVRKLKTEPKRYEARTPLPPTESSRSESQSPIRRTKSTNRGSERMGSKRGSTFK